MSQNTSIQVSIVVLSWEDKSDLERCVTSILESNIQASWELIIVDNGSGQEVRDYLNQLYDTWYEHINLKIIWNGYNMGFAAGNNQALPRIEGTYTLFLNQDIVVTSQAIDTLIQTLEEDTEHMYGTVAPQLRYMDGRLQYNCRKLPTPQSMWRAYRRLKWDDSNVYDHEQKGEREQAMAAALMIRTNLLQDLEGFDEHPGMWLFFNDVDLAKRVYEAGYKGFFTPESLMYHGHGRSTRNVMTARKVWLWHRGLYTYFDKWYVRNWFQTLILWGGTAVSFCGLLLREQIRKLS
ncbi:MAG: glycosyltransferase family 2 protein [Candidatus Paceibacteria bacterium]